MEIGSPSGGSPGGFPAWVMLWTPCVAMLLLSFISLVDRSILGILSPVMLRELHLSAGQYGTAIFVFSLCYMVSNSVWGLLMDRLGLFVAIGLAVAVWSLASGAHALVGGFLGLCVARGVLGFGEGATFPAGLKTVTETMPSEKRSFGLGLAYSGGSLGALLTPIVVVPLALRWGWRSTFLLSAAIGFGWIGIWVMLRVFGVYQAGGNGTAGEEGRQMPSHIARGEASGEVETPQSLDLTNPIAAGSKWNRDLFATAAIYGLGAAPLAYGLYSAPLYLTRVLHLPQAELGHWLWIPPAGWEAGYLFWGRVADWRRKKDLGVGRAPSSPLGLFAGFAVGSLALAAIPALSGMTHAVAIALAVYFWVMFLSGGYVVIALASGATTQAARNTGFLAGFSISGWSLTTGVLMWVVGRMFDRGEIAETFWMTGILPILGVLVWQVLRSPSSFGDRRGYGKEPG